VTVEALWKYFENNHEIFAALVAALAIIGGLIGSVLGAKIQANGGRARASAAREAAQITSEAQRVAALWTVRQVQTAEFLHNVREALHTSHLLVVNEDTEALRAQVREAGQAMHRKFAELQLIAPLPVVAAAQLVVISADSYQDLNRARGPAQRALFILIRLTGDENSAVSAPAIRARDGLEALRRGDTSASDARLMLADVHGLTETQAEMLIGDAEEPEFGLAWSRAEREARQRAGRLVEVARTMLRSDDDVPP
jgi:type II secretory pathway pseudopilin PulG